MAKVKKRTGENLDDATIKKVIQELSKESPITKVAACKILNISYNTKRLDNIVVQYLEDKANRKRLLSKNRGKPWSDADKKYLIVEYLKGDPISELSRILYRSNTAIKKTLADLHIPLRNPKATYHTPELLPDDSSAEELTIGEVVWSARYNAMCEIVSQYAKGVYRIWIYGKYDQYGYQPWYELGLVPSIKELGIKPQDFKMENF